VYAGSIECDASGERSLIPRHGREPKTAARRARWDRPSRLRALRLIRSAPSEETGLTPLFSEHLPYMWRIVKPSPNSHHTTSPNMLTTIATRRGHMT
jgi:hypothetical protein